MTNKKIEQLAKDKGYCSPHGENNPETLAFIDGYIAAQAKEYTYPRYVVSGGLRPIDEVGGKGLEINDQFEQRDQYAFYNEWEELFETFLKHKDNYKHNLSRYLYFELYIWLKENYNAPVQNKK